MRAGTGGSAGGGTGRAGGAAGGDAALLKVGVAPGQATLGSLGSLSRLGNLSRVERLGGRDPSAAAAGGGGGGGGGPGPKDRRKQGGARVRGAALREAEAEAAAAEAAEGVGVQLFQGLARSDAAEVSLVPAAKAEAPRDRFQLQKLSSAQLSRLLRTLGGTAPPEPPPPLVAGGAAAAEAAAAHRAALVAAMKQAMAEAPLALLDEVCLEIEAASAAKPRARRHSGHADGTARHGGGSRHRSASGGCAASGAVGGDGAGGSEGRQGRPGSARANGKEGTEGGTPRERRRRSSRDGDEEPRLSRRPSHGRHPHGHTRAEREVRRLERRVADALNSDRAAVEASRAERALNARLRAAGVT